MRCDYRKEETRSIKKLLNYFISQGAWENNLRRVVVFGEFMELLKF